MGNRIKKHVEEKSKLWKAPERNTFAESISAGNSRRPSPSGFNTARQLPLRANEWQLFLIK